MVLSHLDPVQTSFWRAGMTIARTYALSVGQNKYLTRQLAPLKDRQREKDISAIFLALEQSSKGIRGFDYNSANYNPAIHPLAWPLHSLVVQDPFVPTYVSTTAILLSRAKLTAFPRTMPNLFLVKP